MFFYNLWLKRDWLNNFIFECNEVIFKKATVRKTTFLNIFIGHDIGYGLQKPQFFAYEKMGVRHRRYSTSSMEDEFE